MRFEVISIRNMGWSPNDDDEDPKKEVHECVKHDHNLVIMEDCSTS
jgi:hypothetical protein